MIELIETKPNGFHYSELVNIAASEFPEVNRRSIPSYIWDLDKRFPDKVYKPVVGIFRAVKFRDLPESNENDSTFSKIDNTKNKTLEEDFYQPFADWLKNVTEECTKAIKLGGNKFKEKWGTPDVIGIREPNKWDIIQFPVEIVSAEVKLDPNNLITAFGQACAYRLFSHKTYLVVPKESQESDKARLDILCQLFGLGLVFFDSGNSDLPNFEIRVRPIKQEPDMNFVNENLGKIKEELFK